ncbi:hypothetical protein BAMA_07855 [Bacillus manliponensis]|uniref:Prophage protein n=1 Tax=Bacillus manliponensis TaxID=574376 RepID=A0A073JUW3_9BACI|nr:DUF2691 family protein [Bacillus manliponensis]KEK17941.1 hypothetical protein BAMA_07855 [Bacillus manliponensis]
MKNIGIGFYEPREEEFHTSIWSLIELVEPQKYQWRIVDGEVYIRDENDPLDGEFLFEKAFVDGYELGDIVKDRGCYVIFLNMRAFPKKLDKNELLARITTVPEFINSSCEFMINIVDTYDISILTKDPELLEQLFRHVTDLGYEKVTYITDKREGLI